MLCEWQSQDLHVWSPLCQAAPGGNSPSPSATPHPQPWLACSCMGYFNLLSFQPNRWASESAMRLGEEGYCREPTVEKSLQWADLRALQYLCTKGRGPTHGFGQSLPCLSHQPSPQRLGNVVEKNSFGLPCVPHLGVGRTHCAGHQERGRGGQVCGHQG